VIPPDWGNGHGTLVASESDHLSFTKMPKKKKKKRKMLEQEKEKGCFFPHVLFFFYAGLE
jgi:hypothetical protein